MSRLMYALRRPSGETSIDTCLCYLCYTPVCRSNIERLFCMGEGVTDASPLPGTWVEVPEDSECVRCGHCPARTSISARYGILPKYNSHRWFVLDRKLIQEDRKNRKLEVRPVVEMATCPDKQTAEFVRDRLNEHEAKEYVRSIP